MKYYIGIEGGGTKSDCILADENYIIHKSVREGPLNLLNQGPDEATKTIQTLINSSLFSTEIKISQIAGIGIGIAGAGRAEDASELLKRLMDFYPEGTKIHVTNDAEAALEGAFTGRPGCILISGTGSIIYGKDAEGNIYRCGGYGKVLGDQGSGYSTGKKGLLSAIKDYDNTGKPTIISKMLEEQFQIKSFNEIITSVYKNNFEIAAAAQLVIKAAEMGDAIANQIIEEETNSLLDLISCMINKLKKDDIEIVFTGSLISNDNKFSFILREKISNTFRNLTIKQPEFPPVLGAIFIMNKQER